MRALCVEGLVLSWHNPRRACGGHAFWGTVPQYRRVRSRCPAASPLRRSLRAATAEGAVAEIVGACSGTTVVTGWALYLGAGPWEVGLLAALSACGQVLQFPAAWMTAVWGRRRVAVLAVAASRQAILPLVFLPFLACSLESKRSLLLVTAASSALLGVVGSNAWTAWMGELVPGSLRGRYFGQRTAICTLVGSLAGLSVGLCLDGAGTHHGMGPALAALAAAAALAGVATTYLMSRQHEPGDVSQLRPHLAVWMRPLRDRAARHLLLYLVIWNAAVGFGGSFFTLHLLGNLQAGYTRLALHGAAVATVRILVSPLWGRALDRLGSRPVLAVCSLGIAAMPLFWLLPTPQVLWPIIFDALASGLFWSGHGLASFALPLEIAPRRERAFYLATFGAAGGLAAAVAASLGGALASHLPQTFSLLGHTGYGLHILFVVSAAGRLLAAFLALRLTAPKAGSLQELASYARGGLRLEMAAVVGRLRRRVA
jgi:MFS family permease